MSFPLSINSSSWAWNCEHAMPDFIQTLLIHFSARKFQVSTRAPSFWMTVVTRKWAHRPHLVTEARITPSIAFYTHHQLVQHVGSSLLFLPHLSTQSIFFFFPRRQFHIGCDWSPSGALPNTCASLPSEVYIFWNVNSLCAENGL